MATLPTIPLADLYERDETAWLEIMAELAEQRCLEEMDFLHLSEYLTDMAKRDRREVFSRLAVLLCHILKWEHQPVHRSGSWRGTIREQRRELRQLCESSTLKNHAENVLADAYVEARKQAADETELALATFSPECSWGLEELLDDATL